MDKQQFCNNFNSVSPATAKGCGVNLASREKVKSLRDFGLFYFRDL